MFRNMISQTALTTQFAEEFFKEKIYGDQFMRDCTFVSTLRALVTPRMSQEDKIKFSIRSIDRLGGDATEFASSIMYPYTDERDIIYIVNIQNGDHDKVERYMDAIEKSFESTHSGFCRILKVTDFYRKVFRVLCFVNAEQKSAFIVTDNMDIKRYHFLQTGVFAFLPWYFSPENGVSEIEMELIKSLREKTSDKYEECTAKIAEQYDFRTAAIKGMLKGFEVRYERIQRDRTLNEIQGYINDINNYNDMIGSLLANKRRADAMLLGLEAKIANGGDDSEIMEYFLRNKRLDLRKVNDTTMEFVVKEYLTFFDEELVKSAIENRSSYIYKPDGRTHENIFRANDIALLMNAVFIEQKIKMRVCAAYRFRLESNVQAISSYDYGATCRDYMPNTHIDRFSCLGNYERKINEFIKNYDYIGAIEQCVASCKSLNFGDGWVMNETMKRIYGISDYSTNVKCFELPDGSVVDPKGAIEYLKKEISEVSVDGEDN